MSNINIEISNNAVENNNNETWPTLYEPYYVPDIIEDNLYCQYHWNDDKIDRRYKELNLVFKTKHEAIEVSKKILDTLGYKKKYEVHWISGNQDKFYGTFDTLDEAQDSVRDWWNKNNYTPPYVRTILKEDCVVWDYGLHHAFYIFKKVAYQ